MKIFLKFIIILCVIHYTNDSYSQISEKSKSQIDSLNNILVNPKNHDTTIVKSFLGLTSLYYLNNPDTAIVLCKNAETISNRINYVNGQSQCYGWLGYLYEQKGKYDIALKYNYKSLKLLENIGYKKGIGSSLNNIGAIYMAIGEYDQAIEYNLKSLKVRKDIRDKKGIAYSLNNLGYLYNSQGNIPLAIEYYNICLKIRKEIGDKYGIGQSYNNIGLIYYKLGDLSKALQYFHESLKIREEIGDKNGVSQSYNNIGLIHFNQGEVKIALENWNKSLKIREEIGDKKGMSSNFNNIGSIYNNKDEFSKALEYFYKSLELQKKINYKSGISSSLLNIAEINYSQGDYAEAVKKLSESYSIALYIKDNKRIKSSVRLLYKTYFFSDSLFLAKKYLSKLLQNRNQNLETNFFTLPEHEKQTYFSTMESDYGLYQDFALIHQEEFEKVSDTSYNIALQNKGLTLKSSTAMRQSIQNSGDTTLIKEYENWLTLKKKIANTNTTDSTYKKLTNQANDMERDLVKNSTIFSDFDKVKNLKWQDVQAGLKENEAAIEFVNFKSEIDTANPIIYAALIVKKDSKNPEMVKLCNENDLQKILGAFQGNNLDFVNSVYGNKEKAQTELYKKVWQPMEKTLEGVENIYLSPSGLLHKIAFHAIAKDQNTYLCDAYNIRQQSSTGKVALPDEVAFNKSKEFLMLGGVQYNTDTTANEIWSYLPGSLEETNNIKSYLQKKKYNITHLTAQEAGEESFKKHAPNANILHIATHGFFFPDPEKVREELKENQEYHEDLAFRGQNIDPEKMQRSTRYADWTFVKNKNPLMRSGLALAYANDVWQRPALAEGDDGVLTANEVSTLDLRNTDLVVLSACETGLGDIKGSEGVYGLQRAFKMAGAKYLIMSLWQVPDKETAEFMGLFYKNLVKFEDVREAFSKTQKVMRKKYDPYYWGAFVLVE